MYASEIAPPHVRGRVGGLYAINVNVSYALTEWMGLGFSYITTDLAWRLFFGLQLACPAVMLIGSIWMPQSPRWLIAKGRYEEALLTLQRMHKTGLDDDTFYIREYNQIKGQIELEKREKVGIKTIFTRPSYRHRLYIVLIWVVGQQTTGVIPLQNYQFIVYSTLGLSAKMPLILVGVWGTVGVLCSAPGAWWFDSLGRRRAFFISMGIMLPASILLCAFWATYENTGNTVKVWGDLAVLAMFIFLVGYAVIINSFSYTYIAEILPMAIRSTVVASAFGSANALVILLVQVTPIAIEKISWKYFMIFVIGDAIFLVLFYFKYVSHRPRTF
jgi:MFS family permease